MTVVPLFPKPGTYHGSPILADFPEIRFLYLAVQPKWNIFQIFVSTPKVSSSQSWFPLKPLKS